MRVRARRRRTAVLAVAAVAALYAAQLASGIASAFSAPSVVEAPVPANALANATVRLNAVSCSASTFCAAVGTYATAAGTEGLLETYRSGAWTATEAPLPPDAAARPGVSLQAVACRSTTFCVAVGDYLDSQNEGALLVDTLYGTTWTTRAQALPSGTVGSLSAVACTAIENCVAVGVYGALGSSSNVALIDTLSGRTWTQMAAPYPSTDPASAELTGVACPASGSCVAIGLYSSTTLTGWHGLFEVLSAGTWSPTLAPAPADGATTPGPTLVSVSCWTAGGCAAAGWYEDTSSLEKGLVETLSSGRWTAAAGPLPAGANRARTSLVSTLSCTARSACVAAGVYFDGTGAEQGYVARRGTHGWSAVEGPVGVGGGADAQAWGSACVRSDVCAGAGSFGEPVSGVSGLAGEPLFEALSGTRWFTVPGLVPADAAANPGERLAATSCARYTGPCVAVGSYVTSAHVLEGVLITLPQ